MLRGRTIVLRARIESDVPILHAALYDDVPGHSDSDTRPWRPLPPTAELSPYRVKEAPEHSAEFTIVSLLDDRVVGESVLWSIDPHNRKAHIGLALLPEERRRGFGLDTVQVLCDYAFRVLGLHRVQIETNATNAPMIATAEQAGFAVEGRIRDASWVVGRFVDEVVLGLLVDDWSVVERA
jgi:RimJ/RimL family protein N-acetyltransferase